MRGIDWDRCSSNLFDIVSDVEARVNSIYEQTLLRAELGNYPPHILIQTNFDLDEYIDRIERTEYEEKYLVLTGKLTKLTIDYDLRVFKGKYIEIPGNEEHVRRKTLRILNKNIPGCFTLKANYQKYLRNAA